MTIEPYTNQFPYRDVAFKIVLASGIGLLVGLEREWAQKEIGVRTFAISGLLGMLTSLMAPAYVVSALALLGVLISFLNVHSLLKDRSLELTTSICLAVVFFLGVLVGQEHYFTASAAAIVMMMLLAWKLELERFAGALRPEEIRSAVLLGLLSVVVFPLLPDTAFIDHWQLINPRQYWMTVMVIAGIGFANYVLLRLYSTRGLYYSAVLGGLVNSTAAVVELASQFRGRPHLSRRAVGVLQLTNVSMFARNAIILGIFAPAAAIRAAAAPLIVMALAAVLFAWERHGQDPEQSEPLKLSSPLSLARVVKFSLLFLGLSIAGTLAQRFLGSYGFLAVSIAGGTVSSASTTATAATLAASGKVAPHTAAAATVFASMASVIVNLPLVYQQTRQKEMIKRLAISSAVVIAAGLLTLAISFGLR